ncbi:indoleamine 2,3-dioxygenase 2 isoform X2 [Nematostella vectensis]|uniref:indoleamine 2,3-dioxygenase 2 isoform X2 n=1 Tax=Nematostella vectensis TaxID=45351 RepID=UPI002076E80A|nr:indoleamine 2,3-dioxygenase 2 isoform X2 [Nematostella vectensis]
MNSKKEKKGDLSPARYIVAFNMSPSLARPPLYIRNGKENHTGSPTPYTALKERLPDFATYLDSLLSNKNGLRSFTNLSEVRFGSCDSFKKRMNGPKVPFLEDYEVSPTRGFIQDEDPLQQLPEYFSPWEEVCERLPEMWKDETTRHWIEQLPLLDHNKLTSAREWWRANLVLVLMSHSYVWCEGETNPKKVLPKSVAVPLVGVSEHLGMPPILTHYCYAIYNWRVIDISRPLTLDNIKPINTFTGTPSEDGFITVAVQVEMEFGKSVTSLIASQKAVLSDDCQLLRKELFSVQQMISRLTNALLKIHDVCKPRDFYCFIRVFLNGWQSTSALPEGLIYEGVSSTPRQYPGGSAAESTVFQVLDAFLGIRHHSPSRTSFLKLMRKHMPPKHNEFITAVENGPSVRHYVENSKDQRLHEQYNACVTALQEYRNAHLSIVTKYIIIQANKDPENPNRRLANKGTGGSDLVKFLQRVRDETKESKLPSTS